MMTMKGVAGSDAKERGYYEWLRQDILAWIGDDVKDVLSVGCGGGVTEAELVRRGVRVIGIELQPDAASRARERGVTVLTASAEKCATLLSDHRFDSLIFADVLEHLPDPERVLCDCCALLAPGKRVIVSAPNFRHYSVLWALGFRGEILYTQAGILDRTHIRITSRKMVLRWFSAAGLVPAHIEYRIQRRRDKLINLLSFGLLREFLATQIIVVGLNRGSATVQSEALGD